MKKLAWGIIGAGSIAGTFAKGVAGSRTGRLLAVGSRSQAKADEFGDKFGVERRYGSYEDLLADAEVEAVYVATPHPMHAEWAIKAAEAGKHVLCEKPLTVNFPTAMSVVEAARRNDVFLMEAFMYRCHPQTAKVVELIRSGAIGEVRLIKAAFGFDAGGGPEGRLFENELAGGGILDVGCYPVSFARLVAGAALGKDFADPVEVKASGHLGETGVDLWTAAVLKFDGGIIAEVATSVHASQDNSASIFGSEGFIVISEPWIPAREGGTVKMRVKTAKDDAPREIEIASPEGLYSIEADTVAANIEKRRAPSPAMSPDDTLGNMRTLDRWRAEVGLVYEMEKPERQTVPAHGGPLSIRDGSTMTYGMLAGLEKRVSRLVVGADNQPDVVHASAIFDDYFERGGNCFDTAQVYGGGRSERILGHWIKNRGVREEVVILDKGAHTPWCNPEDMNRHFGESLEKLQTDYVDIYMMHRDNPEIPVGEFMDLLNEHKAAGRIRAFGASNWTLPRFKEAQSYAAAKGLSGFSALSNQLSLADMIEPPWDGCLSAKDDEWLAYLTETQLPLMPWSSQARGFFTDRARPEDRSDEELVRCWYSDDNFERLSRARELAAKYSAEPINIALAWVMAQPFPVFALIGPRLISETASSFGALEITLTSEEVKWLDLAGE